jgi:hypothetical protein
MHEFCWWRAAAADANETGWRSRRCIRLSTHTTDPPTNRRALLCFSRQPAWKFNLKSRASGWRFARCLGRECKCKDQRHWVSKWPPRAKGRLLLGDTPDKRSRSINLRLLLNVFCVDCRAVSNAMTRSNFSHVQGWGARDGKISLIIQQYAR